MSSEKDRADLVRVGGSPVHCPYCKGELEDLKSLVACAACGARHHEGCHTTHGRCATCGSPEKLVSPVPRKRSRGDPLAGSKIKVEHRGDATVYSWKKGVPGDFAVALLLCIMVVGIPVALWILYKLLVGQTCEIVARPGSLEFPGVQWGNVRQRRVVARREDLGRIAAQQVQGQTVLSIDVGIDRFMLKASHLVPCLKPPELEWLANQLNAWKGEDA